MESVQARLFGNILLTAGGRSSEGLDNMMPSGTTFEGEEPIVKSRSSTPSRDATDLLDKIKKEPVWAELESATTKLKSRESQRELKKLAREMENAIVAVELTHAFTRRCQLCPV